MASPSVTYSFTGGTTIDPSQMNTNFTDVVNAMTDGTKDFAVNQVSIQTCPTASANKIGQSMQSAGADSVLSNVSTCTTGVANTIHAQITTSTTGVANTILAQVTACASAPANTISKARTITVTTNGSNPGSGGVCITQSSGAFSTASTTFVAVSNLSGTLTTEGRPVSVEFIPDGTSSICDISSDTFQGEFRILRSGTQIALNYTASAANHGDRPGVFNTLDTPASGTVTYTVQTRIPAGTAQAVSYVKMIVKEL